MSNRIIYIDVDDVISDTTVTFPSLLQQHFGKTIDFEAITSFDLTQSFRLTEEELTRFLDIAHSSEIISEYKPRSGAIESINSFISLGYEIAIVTGRPFSTRELTQEWLAKHSISYHRLIFVDKYSRTVLGIDASDVMSLETFSNMNFCFAVEDSGYMASYLSENMKIPVALLDRPWNRTSSCLDNVSTDLVKRCQDWDEVMETFLSKTSAINANTTIQ